VSWGGFKPNVQKELAHEISSCLDDAGGMNEVQALVLM
jgi:hypothetical protein